MATATRTRKTPAKAEVTEEVEVQAELTTKQIINAGIEKVVEATGVDTQKARYKAMRAIAYQAFLEAIEGDDFDGLVDRAIAGIGGLPTGWTMERVAKADPEIAEKPAAKKTPARKPAAKKPAAAAKATPARRRPARKTA